MASVVLWTDGSLSLQIRRSRQVGWCETSNHDSRGEDGESTVNSTQQAEGGSELLRESDRHPGRAGSPPSRSLHRNQIRSVFSCNRSHHLPLVSLHHVCFVE